jgi:hypothetical protein
VQLSCFKLRSIQYHPHPHPRRTMAGRSRPNILITGTPGTGKTTTAEQLAQRTGLRHINVGDLVKQHSLHMGWDEQHQAYTLDEDKVCDDMEGPLGEGGCVVDHHSCDFFPERCVPWRTTEACLRHGLPGSAAEEISLLLSNARALLLPQVV